MIVRRSGKSSGKRPTKGADKKRFPEKESMTRSDRTTCPKSRDESKLSGLNDFSWYNRNPALTASVAAIPYPYKPGMSVPMAIKTEDQSVLSYTVPGIMRLNWGPTVGQSSDATDPASIVGKEMFSKVREAFSGSIDADAPDFVIYLMALDSIYSYISWLQRVYKVINLYTPDNFLFPDKVLMSMGFDEESVIALKQHRMELFQIITELVGMTRKFHCPAVFDVLNRHWWMSENVYTDDSTINCQLYIFNLRHVYRYSVDSGDTPAGMLVCQSMPTLTGSDVVTNLFTFGRGLINALADSDDAYIISGYLMRAYQGTPEFVVPDLTMGESLVPVYVPEVLMQIENSVALGYDPGTNVTMNNITQDPKTNSIKCSPTTSTGLILSGYQITPTLSIRNPNPSIIDTVEASRLITWRDDATDLVYCGTELCWSWEFMSDTVGLTYQQFLAVDTFKTNILVYLPVTSFDWHPYITLVNTTGDTVYRFGDLHNTTAISVEALKNLHRVCLYSEFNSFGQM